MAQRWARKQSGYQYIRAPLPAFACLAHFGLLFLASLCCLVRWSGFCLSRQVFRVVRRGLEMAEHPGRGRAAESEVER